MFFCNTVKIPLIKTPLNPLIPPIKIWCPLTTIIAGFMCNVRECSFMNLMRSFVDLMSLDWHYCGNNIAGFICNVREWSFMNLMCSFVDLMCLDWHYCGNNIAGFICNVREWSFINLMCSFVDLMSLDNESWLALCGVHM